MAAAVVADAAAPAAPPPLQTPLWPVRDRVEAPGTAVAKGQLGWSVVQGQMNGVTVGTVWWRYEKQLGMGDAPSGSPLMSHILLHHTSILPSMDVLPTAGSSSLAAT